VMCRQVPHKWDPGPTQVQPGLHSPISFLFLVGEGGVEGTKFELRASHLLAGTLPPEPLYQPYLFPFLNSASRYRIPSRAPGCSFFSKSRPSITGGQGGAGRQNTELRLQTWLCRKYMYSPLHTPQEKGLLCPTRLSKVF
jgi:hypothetical protein